MACDESEPQTEWVRVPGVFKLSEFAHVTDFDLHFHAEPAWTDADGEPLYRILQRIEPIGERSTSTTN